MSVFTAFHHPIARPASAPQHRPLRDMLARVIERLADSPLDSPVIQAIAAQAPTPSGATVRRAGAPRAHWRTVPGPDGSPRLEAAWWSEN
ncbi:hypothetical protein ACIGXM_27970 [Kitasatospora sp. NPDC052896]|uniref:hypothetical protein n=1 Tax=Kitasatospora sp. NPDC052896 TaxID=3364061 RepID=UPI0037C85578